MSLQVSRYSSQNRDYHKPAAYPAESMNIRINQSITQARSSDDILSIWKNSRRDFNHVNFATTLNRLSRYGIKDLSKDTVDDIASDALDSISQFGARQIANSVNALAKLKIQNRRFFEAVEQELLHNHARKLQDCNSQELANITNAFAKLGFGSRHLFDEIEHILLV